MGLSCYFCSKLELMENRPLSLKKGDLIYICAPAKAVDVKSVEFAKDFFERNGFRVEVSPNCLGEHGYFSGTLYERLSDLQAGLDRADVKAIVSARGGYGCVQLMDHLRWAAFLRDPKWMVGFSDVTVFHQFLDFSAIPSLHATMPLNFEENSPESLATLMNALTGRSYSIEVQSYSFNKKGEVHAEIIGGNLSILYSQLGNKQRPSYKGKILFIEDVGEQAYAIDRMLHAFKDAGVWDEIVGLIVGSFTSIGETANPTGLIYRDTLLEHFQFRKIPIVFDFPAGHQADNRCLVLGQKCHLKVVENQVVLSF